MLPGSRSSLSSAVALLPQSALRRVELRKGKSDADFGFVLTGERPAVFSSVQSLSLADRAGVRKGDVLLAVNGASVDGTAHEEIVSMVGRSGGTVVLLVTEDEIYRLGLSFAGPHVQATSSEAQASEVTDLPDFAEAGRSPSVSSFRSSSGSHRRPQNSLSSTAVGSTGAFREHDTSQTIPISPRSPQVSVSSFSSHGWANSSENETGGRLASPLTGVRRELLSSPPSPDRHTPSSSSSHLSHRSPQESPQRSAYRDFPAFKKLNRAHSHSEGSLDRFARCRARRTDPVSGVQDLRISVCSFGDFRLSRADVTDPLAREHLVDECTAVFQQLNHKPSAAKLQVSANGISLKVDDEKHVKLWWPCRSLALAWVHPTNGQIFSLIRRTPSKLDVSRGGAIDFRAVAHIFRVGSCKATSGQPAETTVQRTDTQPRSDESCSHTAQSRSVSAWQVVEFMRDLYNGREYRFVPEERCHTSGTTSDDHTNGDGSYGSEKSLNSEVRLVDQRGDINLRALELLTSPRAQGADRPTSRTSPSTEEGQTALDDRAVPLQAEAVCNLVYFDWTQKPRHWSRTTVAVDFPDALVHFADGTSRVLASGRNWSDVLMDEDFRSRRPRMTRRRVSETTTTKKVLWWSATVSSVSSERCGSFCCVHVVWSAC